MGNDLINYLERLQLIAFFAGYPIIYAITYVLTAEKRKQQGSSFANSVVKLLPFAYALSGTLLLGLILKNMSPDYSAKSFANQFQYSYLKIFGLAAILFWIPLFSKKTIFSLIHSLVFFSFLVKDFYMYLTAALDREQIANDMKVYTSSLLINIVTLLFVVVMYFLLRNRTSKKAYSN